MAYIQMIGEKLYRSFKNTILRPSCGSHSISLQCMYALNVTDQLMEWSDLRYLTETIGSTKCRNISINLAIAVFL